MKKYKITEQLTECPVLPVGGDTKESLVSYAGPTAELIMQLSDRIDKLERELMNERKRPVFQPGESGISAAGTLTVAEAIEFMRAAK